MNMPARKVLSLDVPSSLLHQQPPAKFSVDDTGHLTIQVGNKTVTITPQDIRRLDRFMGAFGSAES